MITDSTAFSVCSVHCILRSCSRFEIRVMFLCSSHDLVFPQTGLQVDTNSLVLHNVTEKNSGDYRCVSLDMETFEEISGNTTLFVNCKKTGTAVNMTTLSFDCVQRWSHSFVLSFFHCCISVLKQAVVYPKNDVEMELDDFLTAICRAPSSLPTQTVWLKVTNTNTTFPEAPTNVIHELTTHTY